MLQSSWKEVVEEPVLLRLVNHHKDMIQFVMSQGFLRYIPQQYAQIASGRHNREAATILIYLINHPIMCGSFSNLTRPSLRADQAKNDSTSTPRFLQQRLGLVSCSFWFLPANDDNDTNDDDGGRSLICATSSTIQCRFCKIFR